MAKPIVGAAVLALVAVAACGCAARNASDGAASKPYSSGASTRAPSGDQGSPFAGQQAAGSATRPGGLIDLHGWYLTLPTGTDGTPDTVFSPTLDNYSSPWFQLDPARDGVVLTSDAGGVTTANSTYPRSELREMNGTERASWSNTTGTNVLQVRQAVLTLPTVKPDVVTAQIHDSQSDVMEIRVEGSVLLARYDDGSHSFTLDPAYVLGTPYDLRIVAADGRIDVFYDGQHSGGFAQSGSGWYFKTGSYLQSNTSRGDSADAVGRVVLFSLRVDHSS